MNCKLLFIILTVLLLVETGETQEGRELLSPNLKNIFVEELSGELAREYVYHISRYHRIQGSRGYRDAGHYVLDELRRGGFSDSEAFVESFPSDGKIRYQTWQSPSGWDMEEAALYMVEPYREKIVAFPDIPMSLMTYSNPGDVEAELVWVGKGTSDEDYQGKDVKGKWVLATGYGGAVHRLAVLKYGARAVVCYLNDDRAQEYPDMLAYTGMWPKTEEIPRVTFGFNITRRQGEKLRTLLEQGRKVVLHGWAKGIGLEPYFMDVVVARIEGSKYPKEEFLFCAHLDHPKESANDNASGSAALLDIARTLKKLISEGKLPAPERTIRFLWVPEFYGSMAYIDAHPEIKGVDYGGSILGCLNLDMVGENQEKIHTKLVVTQTPQSIPSVLNDVVANMTRMVAQMNIRTPRGSLSEFNYRIAPYGGGSDHQVFIDRRIPSLMIGHEPDYTHHTSEDTPDKVDPVELQRSELLSCASIWYLANLSEEQAKELLTLAFGYACHHLSAVALEIQQDLQQKQYPVEEMANKFARFYEFEQKHLRSVLNFYSTSAVKKLLKRYNEQLKGHFEFLAGTVFGDRKIADLLSALKRDERIPVRLTRGPLASGLPEEKLSPERAAWYKGQGSVLSGAIRFEIVNFMDGSHSISDIRDAVSAEFTPIDLEVVARFTEDLIAAGLAKWK